MEPRIDRLFARWCLRGDARALGSLFDLTAPRLLRVAIHLCGNAAEAEDFVQAAFLALIEQRTSVDSSRPAWPWLCGVIARKAREASRKAGRVLEVDRLIERIEQDPAAALEESEFDGALAAALDKLEEPYRAVIVLRLRHGMNAADIAHVLGRSPGTVRVQLHRGAEKLRAFLPASLLTASILALPAPRGMAAVRAAVLHSAAAAGAGVGAPFLIGGIFMGNKVLVATCVLVASIALWIWSQNPAAPANGNSREPLTSEPIAKLSAEQEPPGVSSVPEPVPTAGSERTPDAAPEDGESLALIRGHVIDGQSHAPLAGVRVRLYSPRTSTIEEVLRTRGEQFEVQPNGAIRPLSHSDWPYVQPLSSVARLHGAQMLLYDEPRPGEIALAGTISDGEGAFTIDSGALGGVIVCELDGYDRRCRAAHDPAHEVEIALWSPWTLAGRVIDEDGKPLGRSLPLLFHAIATAPSDQPAGQPIPNDQLDGSGSWSTIAEPSGEFSLEVAGKGVFATTPEAGYLITSVGVNPANGQRWAFWPQFTHETAREEVILVARHGPCLRFLDTVSGQPVERVRLLGITQQNLYVRWAGSFFAPGGMLRLVGSGDSLGSWRGENTYFQVWAEGHAATGFSVVDLAEIQIIDVGLDPGSVPRLTGTVLRDGEPASGAEVALLGAGRWWRAEGDDVVDAEVSDSHGAFELEAPAGEWILRFTHAGTTYFERVALPRPEPFVLDLGITASIEVELVDAEGIARPDHVIAMHGKDGFQLRTHSGPDGRGRFEGLAPGGYEVLVPHVTTETSFGADELVGVELARGEKEIVRIELPPLAGERHFRVSARGVANYADWRGRYMTDEWTALGFDGSVPLEIVNRAFLLEIAAPGGRRWEVSVPNDAPDGTVIELEPGTQIYRGVVLDADNDSPRGGIRVHAEPWDAEKPCSEIASSVITDAQGRFEIGGLCAQHYMLSFLEQPERASWYQYEAVRFEPDGPPDANPSPIEVRLPRRTERTHVRGRVVRGDDGAAVAAATVSFRCEFPQTAGSLLLGWEKSSVHTDPEGRFEIELPRTPRRVVRVYLPDASSPALELELEASGPAEAPPLELILP